MKAIEQIFLWTKKWLDFHWLSNFVLSFIWSMRKLFFVNFWLFFGNQVSHRNSDCKAKPKCSHYRILKFWFNLIGSLGNLNFCKISQININLKRNKKKSVSKCWFFLNWLHNRVIKPLLRVWRNFFVWWMIIFKMALKYVLTQCTKFI